MTGTEEKCAHDMLIVVALYGDVIDRAMLMGVIVQPLTIITSLEKKTSEKKRKEIKVSYQIPLQLPIHSTNEKKRDKIDMVSQAKL